MPSATTEEEDLVVLAALAAASARRRRRLAKRSTLVYEYQHFSWSIDLMPPGKAKRLLRFSVEEVHILVHLLHLHEIPWRRRVVISLETALCIVLARLSFPGRWCLLLDVFGRSESCLSTVFNDVVVFLAGRFGGMLRWHPLLTYRRMEALAAAIEDYGWVQRVWGFVDGTFRGFCRPRGYDEQRQVYSGHKRSHGHNWQAIVT